ncbi:movement protein [Sesamum angolense]|uniref:Movement protein n=1 Tax=Sesamum angolense TaxID=2727404 RepID=A0AAE1WZ82_9LAMI|nr:movement protein [Sesamum angolense]
MEFTGNVIEMQLIPKEEILKESSRLREEITVTMKWIHTGNIEVVIEASFKEGIDLEIDMSIMDRRINNLRDGCLGTMIGNLYTGKLMFDIHPRITYNLADQDFSRGLTLHRDFKRNDLMKEGNRSYSITYRIAYALSNTHHSNLFLRKEFIEIPRIFKEFAKVMEPDPIRIPRIGGVDIVIKDHPVLDRTLSFTTEFSSRMSFSEDRIMGYKGKDKESLKALTPQEIRQPVVGRYECMLEIADHEILVAGRDNGNMTLGLRFLKDHKSWGRKGYMDDNQRNLLIFTTNSGSEIQGLIDSDSFYEESEEEIKNLKEALQELKTMDRSEESKLSLENVKRLIQRNFSENPLAWWDRNKIEATLKIKEECKYNNPGFLVRNHDEIKKVNPGIFIKDLAKCRKDFRPLLKETESVKWKWEEIHTQRVHELKQVCKNLPKLVKPQGEDELVDYTDAIDYR